MGMARTPGAFSAASGAAARKERSLARGRGDAELRKQMSRCDGSRGRGAFGVLKLASAFRAHGTAGNRRPGMGSGLSG
jgi:hypothetical protein